jgi:hypothetical protein
MTTASSTVYITQAGSLDYASAEQYGALVALAHGELTFGTIEREVMQQIRDKLKRYVPGRDFILLSGSPLTIAWVCLMISELEPMEGTKHRFLKWNKHERQYTLYEIKTPITETLE